MSSLAQLALAQLIGSEPVTDDSDIRPALEPEQSVVSVTKGVRNDSTSNGEKIINGFRTCAPLLSAVIHSETEDIYTELSELLAKTKDLSETCIEELQRTLTINEPEKRAIRAMVIHVVKDSYVSGRQETLVPDVLLSILRMCLTYDGVSAEVSYEYEEHQSNTVLITEVAFLIGDVFKWGDQTNDAVASAVSIQAVAIINAIDISITRLRKFHISEDEFFIVRKTVLKEAVNIYKSIHKEELKAYTTGLVSAEGLDLQVTFNLVIARFKITLNALIDAVSLTSEVVN